METNKETLEAEIALLELQMKWSGIPSFVYLSAISGILWAFIDQQDVDWGNLGWIIIASIIFSRLIWFLFSNRKTTFQMPDMQDLRIFKIFQENLRVDINIDILLIGISLFCLWQMDALEVSILTCYFSALLLLQIFIFYYFSGPEIKLTEKHIVQTNNAPKVLVIIIQLFLSSFYLLFIGLEIFLLIAVMKRFSEFGGQPYKVLVLVAGGCLLTKYYRRGSYFLTALEFKKKELVDFLKLIGSEGR